jgi:hypothetical protein
MLSPSPLTLRWLGLFVAGVFVCSGVPTNPHLLSQARTIVSFGSNGAAEIAATLARTHQYTHRMHTVRIPQRPRLRLLSTPRWRVILSRSRLARNDADIRGGLEVDFEFGAGRDGRPCAVNVRPVNAAMAIEFGDH